MQNDEQKPDDPEDDLDLDFDLDEEDIEDLADLEDDDFADADDWDDFEEDDQNIDQPAQAAAAGPASAPTGERTFLQKHFNAIAIAVVVALGGGWFLLTSGSETPAPKQATPEVVEESTQKEPEEQIGFLSNEGMLEDFEQQSQGPDVPMPVPLAPAEEETEVLTPLPGEESSEPARAAEQEQETLVTASAETTQEPQAQAEPMESVETSAPTANEANLAVAVPPTPVTTEEIEPVTTQPANIDEQVIQDLTTELKDARLELQKAQDKHQKEVDEKDNKIKELTSNMAVLESQIKDLKQQVKSAEKPAEPAKQVTAPTPKAEKPVAKTQAAPSKPKTVTSSAKKEWVLRSAQPGKAIVSAKNSSDLKNISVGDSLEGIGQIKFIGIENGKWVVVGSAGRINQ